MKSEKIKVLIVDDDVKSQEVLAYHLKTITDAEILGIVSSADEAYNFLLENSPDLIFLDVEMPGKTGFDLVDDIRKLKINPGIIFQTAFDKYAIQAIKNAAFDYLLKPIDKAELLESFAKYKALKLQNNFENRVEKLIRDTNTIQRIQLKSKKGFILVNPDEIYYCLADWNYTDIYYGENKKETLSLNLRKVEELLPENLFFRISRSTLINLKYLTEISRKDHKCTLHVHGKSIQFPITRENIAILEDRMK